MQMIKMRRSGVAIRKSKLFAEDNFRHCGECEIGEFQDVVTRRTMTIARFGEVPNILLQPLFTANQLFDARMVWFDPTDRRFMLTGWERIKSGSEYLECVQSWLVFLDQAPPYPEQKVLPKGVR